MVDKGLLERKLAALDQYVSQLTRFQGYSRHEIEEDMGKAWQVEHGLQLAIQAVLDIGAHILADAGINVDGYGEIIPALSRLGVVSMEFINRTQGLSGFRNVVVHEYEKVDLRLVYDVLQKHLDDFREFARAITGYLG